MEKHGLLTQTDWIQEGDPFFSSFTRQTLSTYHLQGARLGAGDTARVPPPPLASAASDGQQLITEQSGES